MASIIKQKTEDGSLKTISIIPGLAETFPKNLESVARIGSSNDAARADHVHKLPYNEPTVDDKNKFLKGDGSWSEVPQSLTASEKRILVTILRSVVTDPEQLQNINSLGWD